MKYLSIIILAAFFACGHHDEKKEVAKIDTTAITDSSNKKPADTLDVSVYSSYVSESLRTYLAREMKEWSLIPRQSWESYWWDQYKKEKTLVSYISGDFNCDNLADHALILADSANNYSVWAFMAVDNGYKATQLDNFQRENGPVGIGLELLTKGKHHHLDDDQVKPVNVKCEGVTIIFFEKAAQSYYWDNGKVKMIQTGD